MANSVIGALRVNLGLDSAQFIKGAKTGQSAVQKFGASMAKVGAAMTVATTGIALAIKGQLDQIDQLGESAQKLGLPVETLSRLQHAAEMSGVTFETLGIGVKKLSEKMADASTGNKAAAGLFEKLGVSAANADGSLRDTESVLEDVSEAMSQMPDGAAKVALAMDLFGKSGAELLPFLNQGKTAIQRMKEEAESLGLVFTQETADAAGEFNDGLDRLSKTASGLGVQIAAVLAPALRDLANWAVEMTAAFRNLSPETQKFLAFATVAAAAAGPLLLGLGLATIAFAGLGTAIAAVLSPIGLAIAAVAALAAGVALIYANWEPIKAWWSGMWSQMAAQTQSNWDRIKAKLSEITPGWMQAAWGHIVEGFAMPLRAASEVVRLAFEGIKRWMIDPVQATQDAWTGLPAWFGAKIGEIGGQISAAWEQVKSTVAQWHADFYRAGEQIVEGLRAGITSKWDAMLNGFRQRSEEMKAKFKGWFGIQSPSKVFHQFGQFITQGLADGLTAGSGQAVGAMQTVANAINGQGVSLVDRLGEFRSSAESAFVGFVAGAQTARQALSQLAASLAQTLAKRAFSGLFSGLFGGLKIPGFATGTPSAPGGLAMVGERGPELVNLPRGSQVINASRTQQMLQSAGNAAAALAVTVTMDPSTGQMGAFVSDVAGRVVARAAPAIVSSAVSQTIEFSRENRVF